MRNDMNRKRSCILSKKNSVSFISMFIGAQLTRYVFVAANLFFVPEND